MDTLDCADASQLTPARNVSVTALQALALWNNHFMLRQSERLAGRLAKENPKLERQVEDLYRLVLDRSPTRVELNELKAYVSEHGLANACRILLNCNEFMFVN